MPQLQNVEQSYATELIRKAIHLCSLSIPVIYYFITKTTALAILVPLTLVFLLADLARLMHPLPRQYFHMWFGSLLRSHERDHEVRRLNGATYVLLSATLAITLFPKLIFIAAFSILIISDTSAALVGRKYGRHRFMGKSLEGTAAFFFSALVVVAVTPKIEYTASEFLIGACAAAIGALVEATSIKIDDNLSIPFTIGIVMWVLYAIVLPQFDIYAAGVVR